MQLPFFQNTAFNVLLSQISLDSLKEIQVKPFDRGEKVKPSEKKDGKENAFNWRGRKEEKLEKESTRAWVSKK